MHASGERKPIWKQIAMSQQISATVFADAYDDLTGFNDLAAERAGVLERRFPGPVDRRRWHFSVRRGWRWASV